MKNRCAYAYVFYRMTKKRSFPSPIFILVQTNTNLGQDQTRVTCSHKGKIEIS